jgi:hypothetical protein
MTYQAVTVNIPDGIYKKLRQAAEIKHRSVDEIIVEAISAIPSSFNIPTADIRSALTQMTYMNDAALWQAARSTMPSDQRERLEELHHKQQREGLTTVEQEEVLKLEELYSETVLVRAQAAVLLKQRKYDVSDLTQFTPLE